jgi:hypothetical protein
MTSFQLRICHSLSLSYDSPDCIVMASLNGDGFPSGLINIIQGGPSPQVSVVVVSKTALSTISGPTATSSAPVLVSPPSNSGHSGLPTGAIVGIAVAVAVFVKLAIIAGFVVWYMRKKRAAKVPKKEIIEDDASEIEKD